MFTIRSTVDTIVEVRNLKSRIETLKMTHGIEIELGPKLKSVKEIVPADIKITIAGSFDFGFKFDNIAFFPWGTSNENNGVYDVRNLTICVISNQGQGLEVYGFIEFIEGYRIFANIWANPKYTFGWKEKGPWLESIKSKVKIIRKELDAVWQQVWYVEKELRRIKQIETDRIQQEKIDKFSEGFK